MVESLMMGSTWIPSGKRLHNYGKSPCLLGKPTISMAIFNSYVWDNQRVNHRFQLVKNGFRNHSSERSPGRSPKTAAPGIVFCQALLTVLRLLRDQNHQVQTILAWVYGNVRFDWLVVEPPQYTIIWKNKKCSKPPSSWGFLHFYT